MVHFCLARLHFEKGEYDTAMRLLQQVEYDDILMNLNAKTMLLKMYYEQEELSALESLLESFRIYIQRKKMIGYHSSNYKNILRFTRKLIKINPYSRKQKDKLKMEIEAAKPLSEREWLLGRLEAL